MVNYIRGPFRYYFVRRRRFVSLPTQRNEAVVGDVVRRSLVVLVGSVGSKTNKGPRLDYKSHRADPKESANVRGLPLHPLHLSLALSRAQACLL